MTDIPPGPNPDALPAYPEVNPASTPDEAPQTSPTPQEEETGRPHDSRQGVGDARLGPELIIPPTD